MGRSRLMDLSERLLVSTVVNEMKPGISMSASPTSSHRNDSLICTV